MPVLHFRLKLAASATAALACVGGAGCSMWWAQAQPARAASPAPTAPASSPAARSLPAASTSRSDSPVSQAPPAAGAGLVAVHLDPATLVGQTWIFPSADPARYGDNRFTFGRDRLQAANARQHSSGTWSVERDKLCVGLEAGGWGSACYYVTRSAAGDWQIRVLPDGDPVPLTIR